jgi:hypothetical protein
MTKFIIASDIHGSAKWCRELLKAYEAEKADRLLLLGDVLYHGPRNPLPDEYSPKDVVQMLTPYAGRIIAVRGNCESEVDQMVLPFNVSSDYATVFVDGITICLSHGHRDVPPLNSGDVYITGHTHVPLCQKEGNGFYHLNPGSVALPKENSAHGYIVYRDGVFTFKSLDASNALKASEVSNGATVLPPIKVK